VVPEMSGSVSRFLLTKTGARGLDEEARAWRVEQGAEGQSESMCAGTREAFISALHAGLLRGETRLLTRRG
jgi:hypothetical protein